VNVKTIKEFCEEKPFRRFVVHLADGRGIPVEHPEFVLYPPNGQEIIIYQPDDSFDFIDMFQVTTLTVRKKSSTKTPKGTS